MDLFWKTVPGKVRLPAQLLQADSMMAPHRAEGNLAGLLAHLLPKITQAGFSQHPGPQQCLCKPKQFWPPAHYQFPCNRSGSLSLAWESSTADNCKHYTYSFLNPRKLLLFWFSPPSDSGAGYRGSWASVVLRCHLGLNHDIDHKFLQQPWKYVHQR